MNTAIRSEFGHLSGFTRTFFAESGKEKVIQDMTEAIHRANESVRQAVEAGISVELVRSSRHHDGCGNWGDQIAPAFREAPVMQ